VFAARIWCSTWQLQETGAERRGMGGLFADLGVLAFVLAGAFIGGFVNGLTGFGTGLTALPFWLQAIEPVVAAQLVSAASVIGHAATLPVISHAIDWRRLAPMLIAGLIGVPIGTWLLPWISLAAFKLAVGLVLIAYCTFMLLAAGRLRMVGGERKAEAAIGFAGGILGGMAGLSGPVPTVWGALKGWPKEQRRVFLQVFNTTILSAMLAASLVQGLIGPPFLVALVVAVPGTLIGSYAGSLLYRRMDDRRFDRIVLVLLLVSGLGLVWSAR
jgi:uncharacterized membrane protein YfcA